jgi:hypothetical protein
MAKMTKEVRRTFFEGAMRKLYGDRFVTEPKALREGIEKCAENLARRKAVEHGVEYERLAGEYSPYIYDSNPTIYFRSNISRERFRQIFFNENKRVLGYEGAKFSIYEYYKTELYYLYIKEPYPFPHNDRVMDEICEEELTVVFERYAAFMNEAIGSACIIRDVINSASTAKQLEETAPELAEFIPAMSGVTALVPVETVRKLNALFAESK